MFWWRQWWGNSLFIHRDWWWICNNSEPEWWLLVKDVNTGLCRSSSSEKSDKIKWKCFINSTLDEITCYQIFSVWDLELIRIGLLVRESQEPMHPLLNTNRFLIFIIKQVTLLQSDSFTCSEGRLLCSLLRVKLIFRWMSSALGSVTETQLRYRFRPQSAQTAQTLLQHQTGPHK